MKLKQYLENLNDLVKEDPTALNMEVVAAIDDEGNGYNAIHYSPSLGVYNDEDREFSSDKEDWEECNEDEEFKPNAICIN